MCFISFIHIFYSEKQSMDFNRLPKMSLALKRLRSPAPNYNAQQLKVLCKYKSHSLLEALLTIKMKALLENLQSF